MLAEPHCAPALRAARKRPLGRRYLQKKIQEPKRSRAKAGSTARARATVKARDCKSAPSAERKSAGARILFVEAKASTYLDQRHETRQVKGNLQVPSSAGPSLAQAHSGRNDTVKQNQEQERLRQSGGRWRADFIVEAEASTYLEQRQRQEKQEQGREEEQEQGRGEQRQEARQRQRQELAALFKN